MNVGGGAAGLAHMDADNFKSKMNSLAYGSAMMQAAKDYQRERQAAEAAAARAPQYDQVDVDDLLDDPELEQLHRDRLLELQRDAEKRAVMQQKGHGEYAEVAEGDFLKVVTETQRVVVHFFHREFTRCKIMDKHLAVLTRRYFGTRFVKVSAPDAPFFTEKLKIQVLPCVVLFMNGVAVDRIVGFEELGGKDDFREAALERRLLAAGLVDAPPKGADSDTEEPEQLRIKLRQSILSQRESDDEDSDFD